jgi:hypothetical protein
VLLGDGESCSPLVVGARSRVCRVCEVWLPGDDDRWRAYLDTDSELVFYCSECAERESSARAPVGPGRPRQRAFAGLAWAVRASARRGAGRALEDCLRDEPQWRGRLEVKEVELDHEHTSLN